MALDDRPSTSDTYLLVVAETVVGVISIGDVVRGIIDDKEFYIQQLTTYITGVG